MYRVSVIVPVYNGAGHIEKCARSILNQSEKRLELIIINDGSVDDTAGICDKLASEDTRLTVIHQKNQGVSAARNAGLMTAKGEWITFVDADDYLLPEALETLLSEVTDEQIVMFDLTTVWESGRMAPDTIPLLPEGCMICREHWSPELLTQMAGSACRCLYRKELLEDVRFPVGIKLSEDRLFNLAAMGKAEKLRYLKQSLYMRTIRLGSACMSYHEDNFDNNLKAMAVARELLKTYWSAEQYLEAYTRMFMLGGALMSIYQIAGKAYRGKSRLKDIRAITDHPGVKEAFGLCSPRGVREKMLKYRFNIPLLLTGYLWNLKNGSHSGS